MQNRKVKIKFKNFSNTFKIKCQFPNVKEKELQKLIEGKKYDFVNQLTPIIENYIFEIENLLKDEELKNKKRFKRKINDDIKYIRFRENLTEHNFKTIFRRRFNEIKNDVKDTISLSKISNFTKDFYTNNPYLESFPLAREIKRKFIFHCGPTNSGKTYASMQILKNANNGVYLAPLRLLATEIYDDLNSQGYPTSLITGEERKITTGDRFTSSTIEMASFSHKVDVSVIDEVQMISDPQRGWAWTQAIVGIPAETIILAGSIDALPNVKHLIEDVLKEDLEIVYFERKNDLKVQDRFINFEEGDAIIVFSRKEVLKLKEILTNTSVIYGSLSPEVRKKEADKFRQGKTKYIIATDAISMGLNLPIKRVVFNSIEKYDGKEMAKIPSHLIKQISGRAGRFGKFECGYVCGTDRNYLPFIKKALKDINDTVPLEKFQISPNLNAIETIQEVFNMNDIVSVLKQFKTVMINDEYFEMMNLDNMIELGKYVYNKLSLNNKFTYCCAPVNLKDNSSVYQIERWSKRHFKNEEIFLEDIIYNVEKYSYTSEKLMNLENAVKNCNTYMWLSQRFPEIYVDTKNVEEKIEFLNNKIIEILGKNK